MQIYNDRGEYERSLQIIQENETLLRLEAIEDAVAPFMYLVHSFDVYYHFGDFDKIKRLVQQMNENQLYKKAGQLQYSYWFAKAILAEHFGDFQKAKKYFEQALHINVNKYDFRIELTIWITILEKHGLFQEMLHYQQLIIQGMQHHIKMLEGKQRQQLIEEHALSQFQHKLYIDRLTGVKNRAFYEDELLKEKQYTDFTCVVLDIDKFKQINDTYGHLVGDQALKYLASIFSKSHFDENIQIIRYGGDEFIFLIFSPLEKALPYLQEIHQKVANKAFKIYETDETIHFTISMGISATLDTPMLLKDLFKQADDALYSAKEQGRNAIMIHTYHML